MELRAPHALVYHWWDSAKSGKLKAEDWPGYSLESAQRTTTAWGSARRCTRTVFIVWRRRSFAGWP